MTEGPGAKDASRTLNEEERTPGNDNVLAGLGELERRASLDWGRRKFCRRCGGPHTGSGACAGPSARPRESRPEGQAKTTIAFDHLGMGSCVGRG
jgi:hypothetical protein